MKIKKTLLSVLLVMCMFTQILPGNARVLAEENVIAPEIVSDVLAVEPASQEDVLLEEAQEAQNAPAETVTVPAENVEAPKEEEASEEVLPEEAAEENAALPEEGEPATEEVASENEEMQAEAPAEAVEAKQAEAAEEALVAENIQKDAEVLAAEDAEAAPAEEEEVQLNEEAPADVDYYSVTFVMNDESGEQVVITKQTDKAEGTTIGTLPQNPFKSGYIFVKWVIQGTDTQVTADTVVTGDMVVEAVFDEIVVYEVTVNYYYYVGNDSSATRIDFYTNVVQLEKHATLPVTIESPKTVNVNKTIEGETHDSDNEIYYPTLTALEVTQADLDQATVGEDKIGRITREVRYIPFDVTYKVQYLLKDAGADTYTVAREVEQNGIKGSKITPEILSIEGAVFDHAESGVELTTEGQIIKVYYNREEATLLFNTNGGDYIEAINSSYGAEVELPFNPKRTGYTFAGWYLDADLTQEAASPLTLNKNNVVVYSKWEVATVKYMVNFLVENADDDGYSFLATAEGEGKTGDSVTLTASTAGALAPSKLDTDNFTFKESTTETIKADGSTVITVKYSRNVYTISWNGDVYRTNGQRRARNMGSGSVTAKFGATITQMWVAAFNTPYPDYAWSPTTQNNDKVISIDTMPGKGDSKWTLGNNNTFTLYAFDFSTNKTQTLNYWLENYDGTRTTTRNGKTYGLYKSVTGKFNYLYDNADFYQIDGYTKDGYTATYEDWWGRTQNYTLGNGTPDADLDVNFYYATKTYTLAFYNYDGTLISSEEVKLNADISAKLTGNVPAAPVTGATWLGWFTDAEHQSPYSGSTKMPAGLVLYGNFEFPTVAITFIDRGLDTETTDSYTYGEKAVEPASPERKGYVFQGWYTDESYTTKYDFSKPLQQESTTVYAKWTLDALTYTVCYVDKDDNDLADPVTRTSLVYELGQEITETAITIPKYVVDENQKSVTLTLDENLIKFVYTEKPSSISYTVRYVLRDDPSTLVANSITKAVSGDTITVVEAAAAVDQNVLPAELKGTEYFP